MDEEPLKCLICNTELIFMTIICSQCKEFNQISLINKKEYTERGFRIYGLFEDTLHSKIRIQESSNFNGGIWIFCENPSMKDPTPHLSPEQAETLISILQAAIKHQREVLS